MGLDIVVGTRLVSSKWSPVSVNGFKEGNTGIFWKRKQRSIHWRQDLFSIFYNLSVLSIIQKNFVKSFCLDLLTLKPVVQPRGPYSQGWPPSPPDSTEHTASCSPRSSARPAEGSWRQAQSQSRSLPPRKTPSGPAALHLPLRLTRTRQTWTSCAWSSASTARGSRSCLSSTRRWAAPWLATESSWGSQSSASCQHLQMRARRPTWKYRDIKRKRALFDKNYLLLYTRLLYYIGAFLWGRKKSEQKLSSPFIAQSCHLMSREKTRTIFWQGYQESERQSTQETYSDPRGPPFSGQCRRSRPNPCFTFTQDYTDLDTRSLLVNEAKRLLW